MTEETVDPIFKPEPTHNPIGRKADLIASMIAGMGASLSILSAIWFFLGFAENDTRLEHLASAFVLTGVLFAFAIIPFGLVCRFTWLAYRYGTKQPHLLWTIFLMLPWFGLGILMITHTPLPIWWGVIITILAALLSLWTLISFVLDRQFSGQNTSISQQNEMPEEVK